MRDELQKPVVIFIINRLVIGGQAFDTISLANCLQQKFDVHVLYGCKEQDEAEALYLIKKYPAIHYKKIDSLKRSINPINDLFSFITIRRYIKKNNCVLIHTHGSKSGITGRIAAYTAHVPAIIHTFHGHVFHSYYNKFNSSFIRKIEQAVGRITTKVITLSKQQQHEIAGIYKIVPVKKCVIIPLGIDTNEFISTFDEDRKAFRNSYSICSNQIAIGIIGRMVAIKNHSLFIDILVKLHQQYQEKLRFFFVGDGALKSILQQRLSEADINYSEQKNNTATVTFTSWIPKAQQAVSGLDIVVLTSLNEGTPLSLIEAQACGTPVVAANVGGVKDTLLDNETGFLINGHHIDDYINKLQLLIDDEVLRAGMGAKGKTFISEKFSKQKQVDAITSLYEECIGKTIKK